MPRTMRAKKQQPTLTNKNPQAAAAGDQPTNKSGSPGRKANGQFARGNPGGPGNPHARFSAHMLTIARQTMTPEKMAAVFESIYIKALTGDMSAAKLLLHYTIGKPGDAPHPDHIERDEWDLHRKNAIAPDEMKQALGRLPCSLGNEIVGTALPIMTAARANELAVQLRGEQPRDESNGDEDPGEPVMNEDNASETTQDQAAASVSQRDIDAPSPLTNGKTEGEKATGDSLRRSAKPVSPATRRQTPATSSAPIGDGFSGSSAKAKKQRKLVAKQWLQPLTRKLTPGKQKVEKRRHALA